MIYLRFLNTTVKLFVLLGCFYVIFEFINLKTYLNGEKKLKEKKKCNQNPGNACAGFTSKILEREKGENEKRTWIYRYSS
jgi:hypothetical protein